MIGFLKCKKCHKETVAYHSICANKYCHDCFVKIHSNPKLLDKLYYQRVRIKAYECVKRLGKKAPNRRGERIGKYRNSAIMKDDSLKWVKE